MSRKARERVIYRRFVRKFVRTITRVESRVPSKSLGRPTVRTSARIGPRAGPADKLALTGQASSTSPVDPRSSQGTSSPRAPLRPTRVVRTPPETGGAASDQIHRPARPAMNSFSGRPSHPKPEWRQRSQIGGARSATARFFGRVTVPSAVTSAAPGAWRIAWDGAAAVSILRAYWTTSSPARSNGHGGIVSQRANRALRPLCTG